MYVSGQRNTASQDLKSEMKIRTILFIIGILILSLPQGVLSEDINPTVAEKKTDQFSLGAILPLSGPYKEFGDKILKSLILAGGFFDPAKETFADLYVEDSKMQPEKAREGLFKLANREGLLAVIGPLSSEEVLAAAEAAEQKGISLITLTKNDEVTGVGPYCFNALPSTKNQLRHLARYAMDNRRLNRIAILYPDVPAGRDAAEFFRAEVKKNGRKVTHFIPYQGDETNYSQEIETLIGKKLDTDRADADARKIAHRINFDGLFIPDSARKVSQIASQLSFYNVRGFQLLGHSGLNVPDAIRNQRDLFAGAIFVDGYFPGGNIPESGEFADQFYAAYGREPDSLEAYAYDAISLTLQAIHASRATTRERLRQELAGTDAYPGVRGKITADPLRIMDSRPFLITVIDGELVQIIEP
jgi:ABC-type branched-subunit amino acid transport system substrate-binding protein